jgi:two-component system CheB/CheR fusion protein
MWGLRADEVRNKNVFGLDIGLPVEQFRRELRACLSGEREVANLTVQATNRRGKPAECIVTCTPLSARARSRA